MRVLVPGGAGFIGREVVKQLREAGHRAEPAEPDVLAALLTERIDPFDAVVFCQGGRSDDPTLNHEAHVDTTRRVLDAVRPARCVYLSSGEVYGRGEPPFAEDAPLRGTSHYAKAKIQGEQIVQAHAASTGMAGFVLRLAVVYGPGQTGTMLVPALLAAFAEGRPLPMTPGEQTRDFIVVQDVARLILRCLDDDAPPGTYNGGSGQETPIATVAQQLAAIASRLLGKDLTPLLQLGALPYRDDEQMRYMLNCNRAREQLAWRPRHGLTEGLTRTAQAAFDSNRTR
jgi:nucleoside-diphosphate-sugar epimerase